MTMIPTSANDNQPANTNHRNNDRRRVLRHGSISLGQSVVIAASSLRVNLLRALLTALGIIIGTGAVVAIISITEGNTANINSRLGNLSPTVLVVTPQSAIGIGGVRAGAGTASTLTLDDVTALQSVPHVSAVSPIVNTGANNQIIFQNQNWNTRVQGVYPDYQQIDNWNMAEGTWFSQQAEDQQAPDAVLGSVVVQQLFTPLGVDPVGQQIRIGSQTFTVVGVLQSKGASTFGQDPDDIIYVPFTTAITRLVGARASQTVNTIDVQADNVGNVDLVQNDITNLLTSRHGTTDFTVRNQNQIISTVQQTSQSLTLLLVGIAAISLLVGGIGIMNIMLVTVTERTREIGIRIAIGARQRDILTQFLIEATVLTVVGGAIGVIIGTTTGYILSKAFTWPFLVDPRSIILAFGVSAVVGLVFGFYPAQRAARLDPIVALRTE
jgi:putative ABC transport system permease protein